MEYTDKKILIVEDDDMLRNIILSQLIGRYLVVPAKDGEEAIRQIELNRPDLIVLDLLLPKTDGFKVLERLRAMTDPIVAKTPVVVVSNLTDDKSIERAKKYNVEAYFMKADVTMGILTRRIDKICTSGPIQK
jgi:CheY-like chemotaxis protein